MKRSAIIVEPTTSSVSIPADLARESLEIVGLAGYLSRAAIETLRCTCLELSELTSSDPLESMKSCLAKNNSPGARYYQQILRARQNIFVPLESARPPGRLVKPARKSRARPDTPRVALVF